ncbi:E3 ubiquitin-protein ligase CBL-C isoform X3 [Mauremys reevesii]|uniref:E3 ubiquitin-protein ligase CBL-C isoform X3 n=1 Tax=Mauremys reevesii TaxID=260615 RepID=UPI00193FFD40|nr:E3 ubiquitin-protein ligase CBL-C isoform X3 [Mauremys reevesii]
MAAAGGAGARRGPFALGAAARRSLDKALQGLEKLQRLVEQPGLGLRNSPPSLLQLLPQMRQHLLLIRGQPGASLSCLWEAGYFPVYINNLQRKVKQATKLFKGDPAGIFQEGSASRSLVSWSEFQGGLQRVHPVAPGPMAAALRATMDLTCSDHVSIFEFDIFTRLFQPWPTLLKNWTHLAVTHPGYVAFLTYDEVRARLQTYSNKPGSYVFRLSCTRLGQWAIGYVSRDGSILQTIPQDRPLFQALIEGHKEGFYLYPDGKNVNPDLTELTEPTPQNRIEVSPDQAQLYSQMGSTFQLCKICAENDKDVRLQPCGHLLCRDCLNAWQQVQTPTCPFCRREIQGHEEIRIDPVGGQGAGAAPDEDDDDLEDVESVLRELAALRKAGHPAFPPCLDPEVPGPPVPPRLDLLQPRDPDPTAQVTREPRRPGDSSSAPRTAQAGSPPQDSQPDPCRPPQHPPPARGRGDPVLTLGPRPMAPYGRLSPRPPVSTAQRPPDR